MNHSLTIQLFDMMSQARAGKLSDVVERDLELHRLERALFRAGHHHAIIVGSPGAGKTSLIEALAYRIQSDQLRSLPSTMYRLSTDAIITVLMHDGDISVCQNACQHIASQIDEGILFIEDLHLLIGDDPLRLEATLRLLQPILVHPKLRLIASCTSDHYFKYLKHDYTINRLFETIELRPVTPDQANRMVQHTLSRLGRTHNLPIEHEAIQQAIELGARYHHGRSLPDVAIRLLEEASVKAYLEQREKVSQADVAEIVSERENIPISKLTGEEKENLLSLESHLNHEVIGQIEAIKIITNTLLRSRLGLADPTRPQGSFLLLGPSGVGKTETAKSLAKHFLRSQTSFVRLDMSEYSEGHSSMRLIGSPPGYVGYEEGGQLTNPVIREPSTLILLDEIEKAHTKLFDMLLQVLDDGRLTDSAGTTVDFTQTVIIATSNCSSLEITKAYTQGIDVSHVSFFHTTLLPILIKQFRPEFLNRFDAILVYKPLQREHLIQLAQRELRRLEQQLSSKGIRFMVSDETLSQLLPLDTNPLFGARPVKRVIREYFEAPIARKLLTEQLRAPIRVTGTEPWLID